MIIRGQALQKDKSTGAIRVRHISINLGNHQLGDKGFTPHTVKTAVNRACSSGKATVPLVLLEGIDETFPFPDGNIPTLDLGGECPYTWAQNYAAPTFSVSTDSYTYPCPPSRVSEHEIHQGSYPTTSGASRGSFDL